MSEHSVADAKTHLSDLIDRAMEGESVVITRHGRPVAELKGLPAPARPVSSADVDWLAAHRVGKMPGENAGALLRRMRDEQQR